MLLVIFRSHIAPHICKDTGEEILRGVIYCAWLNDHSVFHPPSFFSLLALLHVTDSSFFNHAIQLHLGCMYVFWTLKKKKKSCYFWLLLTFLFSISCDAVLQIQFKCQSAFVLAFFLFMFFKKACLTLTSDLPEYLFGVFCEIKQYKGGKQQNEIF